MRDSHWSSQFHTLWKGARLEQTVKDFILGGGPMVEQGKEGEGRNSTKERMGSEAADHDPHSSTLLKGQGEEVEELGMKE